MTTTDSPLTGREIASSWMIWGIAARDFTAAHRRLEETAAHQEADAVIAVRFVTMPDADARGFEQAWVGYGTAIRYV